MESSRQDLLNDMAEYGPILKSSQDTKHHRFGFTPKTDITFPKTGLFLQCMPRSSMVSFGLAKKKRKDRSYVRKVDDSTFEIRKSTEIIHHFK